MLNDEESVVVWKSLPPHVMNLSYFSISRHYLNCHPTSCKKAMFFVNVVLIMDGWSFNMMGLHMTEKGDKNVECWIVDVFDDFFVLSWCVSDYPSVNRDSWLGIFVFYPVHVEASQAEATPVYIRINWKYSTFTRYDRSIEGLFSLICFSFCK